MYLLEALLVDVVADEADGSAQHKQPVQNANLNVLRRLLRPPMPQSTRSALIIANDQPLGRRRRSGGTGPQMPQQSRRPRSG